MKVTLSSFCKIVQGGRHKLSGNDFVDDGYPAFGAGGNNGLLPSFEFETDAIILSSIGARCGKCFYASGKWSSLANTQVIIPDLDKANTRYIWYQLNDEARWHRSGTAQPFIKPADVKAHQVYLPTLNQQRRIVAVLDEADVIRVKRQTALAQLDEMAQAIFEEMFGSSGDLAGNDNLIELEDLMAEGPQNGIYKPSSNYGEGTPIVRIDCFYDGAFTKLDQLKRVRLLPVEVDSYGLNPGDIVINRVNSIEYVGKAALIPTLPERTVFESNMMRFAVNRSLAHPAFINQALRTPGVRAQIQASAKQAINQASINQRDVARIRLPRAPLQRQVLFATRLEALDRLRSVQRSAAQTLDVLFASLQHRAFTGAL